MNSSDPVKMSRDILTALNKVSRNDPDVGGLLRRMTAKDPGDRPGARECQREMVMIRKKPV